MPRTRKSEKNRDGIIVYDQWSREGRYGHGKRWLYRVRDPHARRYLNKAWGSHDVDDKHREIPGCKAGDGWAEKIQARFRLGQDTAAEAAYGPLVTHYLEEVEQAPMDASHKREVRRILTALGDHLGEGKRVADLNRKGFAQGVREWIVGLKALEKDEKGKTRRTERLTLAPSTKRRYLAHIHSFVRWAQVRGMVIGQPLRGLEYQDRRQAARLGVAKEDSSKEIFNIPELRRLVGLKRYEDADWMRAVVMIYTGLRREEAKRITFADIDLSARLLHVRKGKGVQGGKYRIVPLQDEFCAHLTGARKASGSASMNKHVCGLTGDDAKQEWNDFRRVLRLAEIEPDRGIDEITGRERRLSPHSCRHTFCALQLATGMDSSSLKLYTGHASKDMTEHYARQTALFVRQLEKEGWKRGQFRLSSQKKRKPNPPIAMRLTPQKAQVS